jgi:hypothetical protein
VLLGTEFNVSILKVPKSAPFTGITGLEQEVIEFDETLDEELILKVPCLRYRP